MNIEKIKELAPDLSSEFPRSPRKTLGGYVAAARTLDKCRAKLNGTLGDYYFDCPLDNEFLGFAEISTDAFKDFVATGASDDEVATWIGENAKDRPRIEVINWNNKMRSLRICDLDDARQEFLEGYIPQFVPAGRPVYVWFDVYDLEEGRIS
ncbi:MAG: hypothetical protein ACI9VS_000711 [Candidatus Binatia bacterium]|jgi:hypothetical protein